MSIFKFRAECPSDVVELMQHIYFDRIEIVRMWPPGADVEVTIEGSWAQGESAPLSLAELCAILANIQDGHVMAETVTDVDKYTGERTRDNGARLIRTLAN